MKKELIRIHKVNAVLIDRTVRPFIVAIAALLCNLSQTQALPELGHIFAPEHVEKYNRKLAGQLVDYTHNTIRDRRLWFPSLGQKRDVYVYLPPGYDGQKKFPLMIWLHGVGHDEKSFLSFVQHFDEAIRTGAFPPMVIVAPDGSIRGFPAIFNSGSFYLNSKAGKFEDYIAEDLYNWALKSFCVRPEREAHVMAGASMGGCGAFSLAFKHKEKFGILAGVLPALDLRWTDCHHNYFGNFSPDCIGRRVEFPRREVIGKFFGVLKIRNRRLIGPLVGRFQRVPLDLIRLNNPTDMLELNNIRPNEFAMFVGYGTNDEFNVDAQAEHFIYVAKQRGIGITVEKIEGGRHNVPTGVKILSAMSKFMMPLLAAYVPEGYNPCCNGKCGIPMEPMNSGHHRPAYLCPMPTGPAFIGR